MINIIDAGARYGPHPSIKKLFDKELINIYAFEPEKNEYHLLSKKYKYHKNYYLENMALGEAEGRVNLNILSHNGQTSHYKPNNESHWFKYHRPMDKEIVESYEVKVTTIDSYINKLRAQGKETPNFIKTDTEGSDLSVLKGADSCMSQIYAIRTEVNFQRTWENSPLFPDIFDYLYSKGFELLNIDYNGQGIAFSCFTPNPERYGQLCGTEAVFIRPPKYIMGLEQKEIIKIILFLFCNNCTDMGYLLMKSCLENYKFDATDPLDLEIQIQYLELSKELENKPTNQFAESKLNYELIFKEAYPSQHNFFNKTDELKLEQKEAQYNQNIADAPQTW